MGSSASSRRARQSSQGVDRAPLYLPARSGEVYQDMSQPLSHYLILSSGNTFAVGSPALRDQQQRRREQRQQAEMRRLQLQAGRRRRSSLLLCGDGTDPQPQPQPPASPVTAQPPTHAHPRTPPPSMRDQPSSHHHHPQHATAGSEAPARQPQCPRAVQNGTNGRRWSRRSKRRGQTGLGVLRFALRAGCRMVELTLHNGSAGWLGQLFGGANDDGDQPRAQPQGAGSRSDDPVVYHNANVARGLAFRACLEVIAAHAFETSEFPLILALDNHCDPRRQHRAAQLLRDVLGERLLVPERRYHVLPSPSALRNKVVLLVNDRNRQRRRYAGMAPALRELALLQAATFKSLYASRFATFAAAATYSMAELEEHARKGASTMMEHAFRHVALLRTEDARVDAPNADPAHVWRQGAQLAALYWPHWDAALWVAMGLFRTDNGGCGYVLKPDALRQESVPRNVYSLAPGASRALLVLRIRSLAAPVARLPPNAPFSIVVSVHGAPCDEVTLTTPLARAAGARQTMLHQTFRLRISFPQLAVVLIRICWGGPQADLRVTSSVAGDALAGKPLPTLAEAAEAAAALSQTSTSVHSQARGNEGALLLRRSQRGTLRSSMRASWRGARQTAAAAAAAPPPAARLHLDLPVVAHNSFAVNTLRAGAVLMPLLDRKCRPLPAAHLGVDITYMSPQDVAALALRSEADGAPWGSAASPPPRLIHVSPPMSPEAEGGEDPDGRAYSPAPSMTPDKPLLRLSLVPPESTDAAEALRSMSTPNVLAPGGAPRRRGQSLGIFASPAPGCKQEQEEEGGGQAAPERLQLQALHSRGSVDTLLPTILRGRCSQGPLLGAAPALQAEGKRAAGGGAAEVTYASDEPWPGE